MVRLENFASRETVRATALLRAALGAHSESGRFFSAFISITLRWVFRVRSIGHRAGVSCPDYFSWLILFSREWSGRDLARMAIRADTYRFHHAHLN